MRVLGILLAIAGLALAIYSVPFVTVVALVAFLLGLSGIIAGVRMAFNSSALRSKRDSTGTYSS